MAGREQQTALPPTVSGKAKLTLAQKAPVTHGSSHSNQMRFQSATRQPSQKCSHPFAQKQELTESSTYEIHNDYKSKHQNYQSQSEFYSN